MDNGDKPCGRPSLVGLGRAEIAAHVAALGLEPYRAGQLWRWLYRRGVGDFAAMSNIARPVRAQLAERFTLERPRLARALASADGTRKWLLALADGSAVETVHIPEADRATLCVSSQVGCTLACRFCHTGTQRLVRNLGAAEIVAQVVLARDALGEWPLPPAARQRTNIVLMGMGEPLFNYTNVAAALHTIMDNEGLAVSRRRITLSTAGVVPMIRRCGAELGVMLAVSLHAVHDELRDAIVPLNRKYPIAELMAACRDYPGLSNARRITFEYVMLKGINDSEADARELLRLVRGIPAKINLIPFNAWPGAPYECSPPAAIERFAAILRRAGYVGTVRRPRGQDILAACGQLRTASARPPRRSYTAAAPASSG